MIRMNCYHSKRYICLQPVPYLGLWKKYQYTVTLHSEVLQRKYLGNMNTKIPNQLTSNKSNKHHI